MVKLNGEALKTKNGHVMCKCGGLCLFGRSTRSKDDVIHGLVYCRPVTKRLPEMMKEEAHAE